MDFYLGTINCPGCGVENKLEIVDNFNSLSYEDQIKFLDNRTHILANSRTNSGEVNWYSYCVPCDILTKFYRKKTFFADGIVAHVPMSQPTSKILMNLSKDIVNFLH